jgi:hypothetical protein
MPTQLTNKKLTKPFLKEILAKKSRLRLQESWTAIKRTTKSIQTTLAEQTPNSMKKVTPNEKERLCFQTNTNLWTLLFW